MQQYEHEHTHPANRLLHAAGIPLIFVGIILLLVSWPWGLGLFCCGWAMLFLGHKVEGNRPAFFQGPVYFLVGPLWVAREIKQWLTGRSASSPAPSSPKDSVR
jgi:hypothetical protein